MDHYLSELRPEMNSNIVHCISNVINHLYLNLQISLSSDFIYYYKSAKYNVYF